MNIIFKLFQILFYSIPFLLLLFLALSVNQKKQERVRQLFLPLLALLYCIIILFFVDDMYYGLLFSIEKLSQSLTFLQNIDFHQFDIYLMNIVIVIGYLICKPMLLSIANFLWNRFQNNSEGIVNNWYTYDEEMSQWFLRNDGQQVRTYCKGIYISVTIISLLVFVLGQFYPKFPPFQVPFYPVVGMIIIGELYNFLNGLLKSEYTEDILGEDEESFKVSNYGLLRDVYKELFPDRVLFDHTIDNGLNVPPTFETIEELCNHKDGAISNLGKYFKRLKYQGKYIDSSYVKSCVKLMEGNSVLFANPFYRDLSDYLMIPMTRQLMKNRKTLVVMGRDAATKDVVSWLNDSIKEQVHTDSLWKVDILGQHITNADIGVLKFCDLFNLDIQNTNLNFLENVGFVLIIEPSKILATGQMGLNLLVSRFNKEHQVVYAACDRNCDGLVDALSHVLRTNITEVSATSVSSSITSMVCWEGDGAYMHHRIFSNISRYLGVGSEINSVALKHQIANTKWLSGEKYPVIDQKWISGQYYKTFCTYAGLSISQESFNKAFQVDSNLWSLSKEDNAFLVVEDEFQNLFEMVRLFSTRSQQQSFINVISDNYLLRDYMIANAMTFINDPKAVPTIVADYTRSKRNTVLKLLIRMASERVEEHEIAQTLTVSGIEFDEDAPIETFKQLVRKHCSVKDISIRVYFKDEYLDDGLTSITRKYYTVEEKSEIEEFIRSLKNAYYIAEDEKGETYYIGAKLYGHVFQALLPGQFLTYDGKYYEVQSITSQNGVVVRRAADHINGRKYYRQSRNIVLSDWVDDEGVGGQKSLGQIQIKKGYCSIEVATNGYLEMSDYHDFKNARYVHVSNIPNRIYHHKLVLKLNFEQASEKVLSTITLLLNEIFKTTYPDAYPYICAITKNSAQEHLQDNLRYLMYTCESNIDEQAIYIIEDSEIDLGLIVSVERNLERYLQIIEEYLTWHEQKMVEVVEDEEYSEEFVPEFLTEAEKQAIAQNKKAKGSKKSIWQKIKSVFTKKKSTSDAEIVEEEEHEFVINPSNQEEDKENSLTQDEQKHSDDEQTDAINHQNTTSNSEKQTTYQKECYLKYGYDEICEAIDISATITYLSSLGYDHSPLQQVRDNEKLAQEYEQSYDPHKKGAHFCDFCGEELTGGEYEVLKDGRERCNHCSATALRSGEEFKDIFRTVLRNMEIFYGIKFNIPIKVRMCDAKKIAKHCGFEFVPTPGFDGRVLGFAQKDGNGYSIFIENGSPRLAAMATIAHELTHIWQYLNWNEAEINQLYGKQNSLEVYEGMAKWVEIQFLLYLNEIAYAKREEILTVLREDEYGRGFIQYRKKYPLSYNQEKRRTPFHVLPPL